jgi:hypothetical protein
MCPPKAYTSVQPKARTLSCGGPFQAYSYLTAPSTGTYSFLVATDRDAVSQPWQPFRRDENRWAALPSGETEICSC